MVKADAIRQSRDSIYNNANKARALYNSAWNEAHHAPMFAKITKRKDSKGRTKKKYRTARLIGSHAYNIAASGAALYASRVLEQDCIRLRHVPEKESKFAPWMPRVSKGARMGKDEYNGVGEVRHNPEEEEEEDHDAKLGAGRGREREMRDLCWGGRSLGERVHCFLVVSIVTDPLKLSPLHLD